MSDLAFLAAQPVQLPGRVVGNVGLRGAPAVREDTLIRTLGHNEPLWVYEPVVGEDGESWYRVGEDQYVSAAPVRLPRPPAQVFPGRWIAVGLRSPALITAYDGDQVVYAALAIKGRGLSQTPEGIYEILRRVYDETMDSETLGIPRDDPEGHYLENVLYTQYFTDEGDSLHYNYWSSNFGEEGNQGCLGLRDEDAAWFWDWAVRQYSSHDGRCPVRFPAACAAATSGAPVLAPTLRPLGDWGHSELTLLLHTPTSPMLPFRDLTQGPNWPRAEAA